MPRSAPVSRSARALVLGLVLLLAGGTRAFAQAVNVDAAGVAVSGYDPVAYFTDSAAVKGSTEFTTTYQGASYRFASAAHRDTFQADPAKYAPMYGGYCAYGVAKGNKVGIDPDAYRVYEGRLYLNYSSGIQKRWVKDIPGYIAEAERAWPGLRDRPRD